MDITAELNTTLYFLDLIGTFVFAVSGMLTASDKRFDVFGAAVIAFVTAVGGGTLRDLLIGSQPVGWMSNPLYLYLILLAIIFCLLFKRVIIRWRKTMFLFDTIGIGVFTILGLLKSMSLGLSLVIALLMGMVSAVFGGVIRDVLTNEVPLIFRQEIYATACLAGGLLFLILHTFIDNRDVVIIASVLTIISVRIMAVKFKWKMPVLS